MNVVVRSTGRLALALAVFASLPTATHAKPSAGSFFTRAIEKAACDAVHGRPLTSRRFTFPRDDGAHDGYAVEWWRTFGRVTDDAGKRFDFGVNVSRFAVDESEATARSRASRWAAHYFLTTSYEILDETTGAVARDTIVDREGDLGARVGHDAFAVVDKTLRYSPAPVGHRGARNFRLALNTMSDSQALFLEITRANAAVPLGPGGVMQTGSCVSNAAYAYAYPRNATHGVLRLEGISHRISGSTWFEHEFAQRELADLDTGWSRYEVQFDDGRFVDARFARDAYDDIVATSGVYVAANGKLTYLTKGSAAIGLFPPGSEWRSDATGTAYPATWMFGVKPGHLGLATVEVVHDQEIRVPGRTPYFWGAIDVEKAEPPGGDRGHGFVELTGYAGRRTL